MHVRTFQVTALMPPGQVISVNTKQTHCLSPASAIGQIKVTGIMWLHLVELWLPVYYIKHEIIQS